MAVCSGCRDVVPARGQGISIVGVVVSMDGKPSSGPSIDPLVGLTADGMERVNQIILNRVGSDVMLIPEIAQHLINSGGKRLRPMLTLATASLSGYQGDGAVKLAASVEFMHTETTEDEYLAVIRGKTAALFAAACEVGPIIAGLGKAEQAACRSYGANLGIAFQLIDDALDYGGASAKLGKKVGDDFREGKITLPVVLSFRRGNEGERAFWKSAMENGNTGDAEMEQAMAIMRRHRAIEDTIERARHYGAMAVDALALFPDGPMKAAMLEAVDFCIARTH